jgi:hypothetical protein
LIQGGFSQGFFFRTPKKTFSASCPDLPIQPDHQGTVILRSSRRVETKIAQDKRREAKALSWDDPPK